MCGLQIADLNDLPIVTLITGYCFVTFPSCKISIDAGDLLWQRNDRHWGAYPVTPVFHGTQESELTIWLLRNVTYSRLTLEVHICITHGGSQGPPGSSRRQSALPHSNSDRWTLMIPERSWRLPTMQDLRIDRLVDSSVNSLSHFLFAFFTPVCHLVSRISIIREPSFVV
jgi:hypothetical protein